MDTTDTDKLITIYIDVEQGGRGWVELEGTLYPDNQVILEDGTAFYVSQDKRAELEQSVSRGNKGNNGDK